MKWPIESKQHSLIQRSHRELSRDPPWFEAEFTPPRLVVFCMHAAQVVNHTSRHVKKVNQLQSNPIGRLQNRNRTEKNVGLCLVRSHRMWCNCVLTQHNTTQQITPRRVCLWRGISNGINPWKIRVSTGHY